MDERGSVPNAEVKPKSHAERRRTLKCLTLGAASSVGWFGPTTKGYGQASNANAALRIVVPFAPGGGNDVFARQLAKSLTEIRRQNVLVENKPGAGGNIGSELVARSTPDGLTLLLGHTGTISINPALYRSLKFDARKDLMPVAMFASTPLVLVVPSNSPYKSFQDLVAAAKAQPGQLNFGSSGNGTGGHLTGELFEQLIGTKLSHIPYKGSNPALTDLAGGQVQFMFSVMPPAIAMIQSGRLRPLAVTSSKRHPLLPQVPTVAESGLSGLESALTYGVLAPLGTPESVVRGLAGQILAAAATKEFQARLEFEGALPFTGGPQEYATQIARESAKWEHIVRVSGATVD